MRLLLLILMSFCAFAVEPDIHLPTGKDLPAWVKDLNKKFELAAGENAPWKKLSYTHHETKEGDDLRHKVETEYREAYEAALVNFAKTANYTKKPTNEQEAWDYTASLGDLSRRIKKTYDPRAIEWQPDENFYIAYAKLNHDSLALAFLVGESNRAKYCR